MNYIIIWLLLLFFLVWRHCEWGYMYINPLKLTRIMPLWSRQAGCCLPNIKHTYKNTYKTLLRNTYPFWTWSCHCSFLFFFFIITLYVLKDNTWKHTYTHTHTQKIWFTSSSLLSLAFFGLFFTNCKTYIQYKYIRFTFSFSFSSLALSISCLCVNFENTWTQT